jgi:hypothetical protein
VAFFWLIANIMNIDKKNENQHEIYMPHVVRNINNLKLSGSSAYYHALIFKYSAF